MINCKQFLTGFLANVTTGVLLVACSAGATTEATTITALPAATIATTPTIALATVQPIEETIDVVETDVQSIQTVADVNIRSGPSTDHLIVGSIFAGQTSLVTGITPDNGWWRVICPDDSVGNCFVINDPSLVQPANAPGVAAPAGETTTYRDESAGFAFDYPSSWTILGDPQPGARGYILQLVSWPYIPGESTEERPPGGARLDVSVLDWDPKQDLAAYIEVRKQAWAASGISIVSEETELLPGDHPAMRFGVTSPNGSEQSFFLLTTVGDQYLTLSGYGDLQAIDAIAQTLEIQP